MCLEPLEVRKESIGSPEYDLQLVISHLVGLL